MTLRVLVLMTVLSPICAFVSASERLSLPERNSAIQAIRASFQERYVFPEMRQKIVDRLDQSQRSGRYETDDPIVFADRVTEDLRSVSHDRHLSLRVDPAAYAAALAPPASEAGEDAFMRRSAIRDHHGLVEMKILPGNIRYLKIAGFEWINDETGTVYDEAMRFLKDGDAVVIDLRNNGGGSHAAVRYLVSHFLDGDTLELTFHQGSEMPAQSRILEHLPAGRLTGKPLYVLINGQTASAAEAFTYDVQQFNLGELVGEKTAGAANNNKLLPVAPHFILSVSYGRPVHAVSNSNWEAVGIAPDVEAQSAQALDTAQMRALTRLARNSKASPEQLGEYAWAKIGVEANLHPPALSSSDLSALSGRYVNAETKQNAVEVRLRDGALWMVRPKHPDARLTPLTSEVFAVEGYEILRIRLTGKMLEMLWSDESAPRIFARE